MIHEKIGYKTQWLITKYANDEAFARGEAFEQVEIKGNLLLIAGVTALWTLAAGSGTAFSNANARLGVGDSTTAEVDTQTALIASTNKTYKAMQSSYPVVAGKVITFRSVFASADANYAWQEFTVDNGTTALNRKVSNQGTKVAGQSWTLDLAITLG